jgi:hypothetical protein
MQRDLNLILTRLLTRGVSTSYTGPLSTYPHFKLGPSEYIPTTLFHEHTP